MTTTERTAYDQAREWTEAYCAETVLPRVAHPTVYDCEAALRLLTSEEVDGCGAEFDEAVDALRAAIGS